MRKLWYAGATLAGGILLFAATPAQADPLPGADAATQQADEQLADVLGQSNGINVDNPLGHSSLKDTALGRIPIAQFKAGQNSPDLNPVLPGKDTAEPRRGLIPRESGSDERPSRVDRPELPAADVVPDSTLPIQGLPLFGTDVSGLPWMTSLLPSGQTRDFSSPPTMRQAEMFSGGVPLLGGLGGMLPANSSPRVLPTGDEPDISGMPAGGVALLPAAVTGSPAASSPAASSPAASSPAVSSPAAGSPAGSPAGLPSAGAPAGSPAAAGSPVPAASVPAGGSAPAATGSGPAGAGAPAAGQPTAAAKPAKPAKAHKQKPQPVPEDPRLHEEPVAGDTQERRPFSADGRPVAGVDKQYR